MTRQSRFLVFSALVISMLLSGLCTPILVMAETAPMVESGTSILKDLVTEEERITPQLEWAEPNVDWSNVVNINSYMRGSDSKYNDGLKALLLEYGFAVDSNDFHDFASRYELNRYSFLPNFITTDAMLNGYHVYFSTLLKKTEKQYLFGQLSELIWRLKVSAVSDILMLSDGVWQEAASKRLAFLSIAEILLQGDDGSMLPQEVAELVETEVAQIMKAEGVALSPLFGRDEDYSQYKPRGYYEGDEQLERYFRAVMFLGRFNFAFSDPVLARAASMIASDLLIDEVSFELWQSYYSITEFFAGESDDVTVLQLAPLMEKYFGPDINIDTMMQDSNAWEAFYKELQNFEAPAVHSVVLHDYMPEEDKVNTGFRLLGQRFTWDASIFQELIYQAVLMNDKMEQRMLPDVLDVPAAYGSKLAESLLEEAGHFKYENYPENLKKMQEKISEAGDEAWTASLSSAWQYCLLPLLEETKEGYPRFMQSDLWELKQLECFAGSYTELKHDTVLYAKQAMAEMGGVGFEEKPDDRGFVEMEPLVFARLQSLAELTRDGLAEFGCINEKDYKNLSLYAELAARLAEIASKELRGELPTEEEFDLIRSFGGQLEHLLREALRKEGQEDWEIDMEEPALVTDVATDPNGEVLELAVGNPSTIYVLVEVDGVLKIASGTVYNFYQFPWPMSDRLTDDQWREMIRPKYLYDEKTGDFLGRDTSQIPAKPAWTTPYRFGMEEGQVEENSELTLPDFLEWQEGTVKAANKAYSAEVNEGRASVYYEGQKIFESEQDHQIQQLAFADFDQDGKEELALLCWKHGRFGKFRPFG